MSARGTTVPTSIGVATVRGEQLHVQIDVHGRGLLHNGSCIHAQFSRVVRGPLYATRHEGRGHSVIPG